MAVYTEGSEQYGGISWSAVLAGALAAAAFTIILSLLGSGLGLAVVSPWSNSGIGAAAFGISAILWLSITQIIASGMGGFLAGRLRVKWLDIHTDEVYFRDTVHGFLTWAIALVITATLFASFLSSVVSGGAKSAAMIGSHAAMAGASMGDNKDGASTSGYYLDSLFRSAPAASMTDTTSTSSAEGVSATPDSQANMSPAAPVVTPEVRRIFTQSLQTGSISAEDKKYVGQLISQRTGLTPEEAEKRVDATYTAISNAAIKAKAAADKARKASAYITLWAFIALLIGAFSASLAATWGGRCRDSQIDPRVL